MLKKLRISDVEDFSILVNEYGEIIITGTDIGIDVFDGEEWVNVNDRIEGRKEDKND